MLVLGAGLCAAPAVELLSRDLAREGGNQRTHVRVVSATPGEAEPTLALALVLALALALALTLTLTLTR